MPVGAISMAVGKVGAGGKRKYQNVASSFHVYMPECHNIQYLVEKKIMRVA